MNKLIAIVGPSGSGKTSLLRALESTGQFITGLEQHAERPFQSLFEKDKHYALANQVDYLLYRADQEKQLRSCSQTALVDGGLDMDFQGFTRLFHARGWLSQPEFEVCERLYRFSRAFLPLPDLFVCLYASPEVIRERLASRKRINIASADDSKLLESFLDEWLAGLPTGRVVWMDVSEEPPDYSRCVAALLESWNRPF